MDEKVVAQLGELAFTGGGEVILQAVARARDGGPPMI
jgi:hypothetical protein